MKNWVAEGITSDVNDFNVHPNLLWHITPPQIAAAHHKSCLEDTSQLFITFYEQTTNLALWQTFFCCSNHFTVFHITEKICTYQNTWEFRFIMLSISCLQHMMLLFMNNWVATLGDTGFFRLQGIKVLWSLHRQGRVRTTSIMVRAFWNFKLRSSNTPETVAFIRERT